METECVKTNPQKKEEAGVATKCVKTNPAKKDEGERKNAENRESRGKEYRLETLYFRVRRAI